jgi:SAM-dependent methyltransferase
MTDAPFVDGTFDGVFAMHSIWHVPRHEHAALFAGLRRCLRDGGVALLTMAALPADQFSDGPGLFTELCGAPIFYDAHRADVSTLLADAGFEQLDADPASRGGRRAGAHRPVARAPGLRIVTSAPPNYAQSR